MLQAFWWDYYNDTYRFKWADYLTELAPRLKSLGIDAVWLPPAPKNKNATNDVGYSPYDLGDKYQKGDVRTSFGSKDEFLRLVAVLHANGIEVIQDVVLNHTDGAGTTAGDAGQDPEPTFSLASNSGYKTFRYSSFATSLPKAGDNGAAYAARQGRWPKTTLTYTRSWATIRPPATMPRPISAPISATATTAATMATANPFPITYPFIPGPSARRKAPATASPRPAIELCG